MTGMIPGMIIILIVSPVPGLSCCFFLPSLAGRGTCACCIWRMTPSCFFISLFTFSVASF